MVLLHGTREAITEHQALDVTGLGCVSDNGSRGLTLCTASANVPHFKIDAVCITDMNILFLLSMLPSGWLPFNRTKQQ